MADERRRLELAVIEAARTYTQVTEATQHPAIRELSDQELRWAVHELEQHDGR
jgi:hypothetical protein